MDACVLVPPSEPSRALQGAGPAPRLPGCCSRPPPPQPFLLRPQPSPAGPGWCLSWVTSAVGLWHSCLGGEAIALSPHCWCPRACGLVQAGSREGGVCGGAAVAPFLLEDFFFLRPFLAGCPWPSWVALLGPRDPSAAVGASGPNPVGASPQGHQVLAAAWAGARLVLCAWRGLWLSCGPGSDL